MGEGGKEHWEGVHDDWRRRTEKVPEADSDLLLGFGTKQTLAGLSLFLWTGSGGEVGEGDEFPLNTLVPGLESPWGG